jgi:hypothetical protein
MGGGVEASAGEDRATPQQAAQEALCLEHGQTLVCFSPFAQVFGMVAQPWPDERNAALAAEAPRHVVHASCLDPATAPTCALPTTQPFSDRPPPTIRRGIRRIAQGRAADAA